MSSVRLNYKAEITLIDRTAPLVTPINIAGDATGSLGTDTNYFVDLELTSSGVQRFRHGVLKLRSVNGIFINSAPILIDAQTKSKYWIDARIVQEDSTGAEINGELFRMQIGTPIVENTDKGLFLTIPLIGIEYVLKESLDSDQLILQTPKEAFTQRIINYTNHQGSSAPLITINNINDIKLPDNNVLRQNWVSDGPVDAQRLLNEIIERLANPSVVGGSFQDYYYSFNPNPTATRTLNVFAEEFGDRSSGVILDVLGPTNTTTEEKQTFQTDNLKFKNVVVVTGNTSAHRLPMAHTRFASDVEHAKVSEIFNVGTQYVVGEYVQYDVGNRGGIQLFKCIQDTVLPPQPPDAAPAFWNNLSTSIEFSPWTNNSNHWKTNFADHLTPPTGYVGLALDMNLARANYDRTNNYNEFEEITFKWVTKVGINNPANEPTAEIFDGQRYIVGSSPTGDFANQANRLAQYDTSVSPAVWRFSKEPTFTAGNPPTEDSVLDLDTGQVYGWNGTTWTVIWTLATNSSVSSPLHPIKSISNVTGATGVESAVQFEYDWDITNTANNASRGAWFNLWFPFPRQANSSPIIPVGDLYKQPVLDFNNLNFTPKGLSGWNNGRDSEDLGTLRGINCKMRLRLEDSSTNLIDFIYDLPIIWWFIDKFDRIVYTETKLRRNGEWDTVEFAAGPESNMQLYDNRIDELVNLFGITLPFNFFLQEKEYTGVRFDWRQVKGMGAFYKDAYDENFFYKNAQSVLFDSFIQHITQTALDLVTTFETPLANVVIDNAKLAIDELTFVKDSYVSSRDVSLTDSRQKLESVQSQSDYINMKLLAQGIEVRDAFFPQMQTLDAYGDVRMRFGLSFVAQGTRVPSSPLTMVALEVTHSITQSKGYRLKVIGVNKFTVSS